MSRSRARRIALSSGCDQTIKAKNIAEAAAPGPNSRTMRRDVTRGTTSRAPNFSRGPAVCTVLTPPLKVARSSAHAANTDTKRLADGFTGGDAASLDGDGGAKTLERGTGLSQLRWTFGDPDGIWHDDFETRGSVICLLEHGAEASVADRHGGARAGVGLEGRGERAADAVATHHGHLRERDRAASDALRSGKVLVGRCRWHVGGRVADAAPGLAIEATRRARHERDVHQLTRRRTVGKRSFYERDSGKKGLAPHHFGQAERLAVCVSEDADVRHAASPATTTCAATRRAATCRAATCRAATCRTATRAARHGSATPFRSAPLRILARPAAPGRRQRTNPQHHPS